MAKGVKKTVAEIADILFDAAREGVKKAAKKHGCSVSSVYGMQYRYPELWEKTERKLKPVIRMDAYESGSLAQKELVKRLSEDPKGIGTGQLVGIIRESYSIFERFARIEGMKDPREALLDALKNRAPEVIALVKEILWAIPEEDLNKILDGD